MCGHPHINELILEMLLNQRFFEKESLSVDSGSFFAGHHRFLFSSDD